MKFTMLVDVAANELGELAMLLVGTLAHRTRANSSISARRTWRGDPCLSPGPRLIGFFNPCGEELS